MMAAAIFLFGVGAASYWDWSERRVPNAVNTVLGLSGMAVALALNGLSGVIQAGLGMTIGFLAMLGPFLLRVYLGGDVKLVMAMGAWLGPVKILNTFAWGAVLGGVLALGFVLKRKWGWSEPSSDASLARVPMAVPFAVSGVLAFFELGY